MLSPNLAHPHTTQGAYIHVIECMFLTCEGDRQVIISMHVGEINFILSPLLLQKQA